METNRGETLWCAFNGISPFFAEIASAWKKRGERVSFQEADYTTICSTPHDNDCLLKSAWNRGVDVSEKKEPRVAILGWGSLLWEGGSEFDNWHGPWQYDGPSLKIEFSRISSSRLGALTLVIDAEHGSPTTVAWCLSKRDRIEDAVADLRCREGTTNENIGCIRLSQQPALPDARKMEDRILVWAREKKLDAAVWTALESNFPERTQNPFSVDAVIAYLKTLSPAGKVKAVEYVWRAPEFVQTPVRSALQTEPWFSKPTG